MRLRQLAITRNSVHLRRSARPQLKELAELRAAHKLIHRERGVPPVGCPDLLRVKEEALVRAETARRLLPPAELHAWATTRAEVGPVTVADVCDERGVPEHVAREARPRRAPPRCQPALAHDVFLEGQNPARTHLQVPLRETRGRSCGAVS